MGGVVVGLRMEDSTILIISTSWLLFALSVAYFVYRAHCTNVVLRSSECVLKSAVIAFENYRKFKEFELKARDAPLGLRPPAYEGGDARDHAAPRLVQPSDLRQG